MPEFTPSQIDKRIQSDPEMQDLAKTDETEFLSRHEQIYNEFGYNADGSPLSTAMKGIQKVSKFTGIPKDVVQGAANMPIPAALTAAGVAVGSAAPGPVQAILGATGSVLGEHINYQLGLRDKPGDIDNAMAAGAPLLGPLVSRSKSVLSDIGQGLPGAGKHMHNLAAEAIAKQAGHMEVTDDMVNFMRQNFKTVPSFKVDVPNVRAHVAQEISDVTKSLTPDEPYIKKLNILQKSLSQDKSFSFEKLMATEKSFIQNGAEDPHGVWKKLSGVLVSDLQAQAKNPALTPATRAKIQQGVDAYTQFVAVNKRKQGQDALNKFLGAPVITQLDDGMARFNKVAFLKQLDSKGMSVFEPSEIADMKKAVSNLGYIGAAPQSFTSNVTHTGSLGLAGLAGYSVGGVQGVIAATALVGTLRAALGSEYGRKAVEFLAKKGHGKIDQLELKTMLGQITAGANAGMVAGVSGRGTQTGTTPFQNEQ